MQICERDIKTIDLLGEFADKEKKFGCVLKKKGKYGRIYWRCADDIKHICVSHEGDISDWGLYRNINKKIIGSYHLGSIQRYIQSKHDGLVLFGAGGTIKHPDGSIYIYRLDTTLPPMEQDPAKKKEIYEFLLEVSNKLGQKNNS